MRHIFFATCPQGLESSLLAEAKELGLPRPEPQTGGIKFEGALEEGWRANLWLRSAGRVLLRLARFHAGDDEALYRMAGEVEWERWMEPEGTLRVQAQLRDSNMTHSRFAEQRVKDAIVDRFRAAGGTRPSVGGEDSDLRIHLHVSKDRATLSLDMSGAPLFKRGWRQSGGIAPLRENLAAGILLMSGWDRRAPLLDPFCGTGTFLIEAAHMAGNIAPGLGRDFGFERWRGHDAARYAKLKDAARAAVKPTRKLRLIGSDRRAERLEEAETNARAAGVAERIVFESADARSFDPRPGWNAWIVTNPPYGGRADTGADLMHLYSAFGERLRAACEGYTLTLLTAAGPLPRALGLTGCTSTPLANGGIDCELLIGRL